MLKLLVPFCKQASALYSAAVSPSKHAGSMQLFNLTVGLRLLPYRLQLFSHSSLLYKPMVFVINDII